MTTRCYTTGYAGKDPEALLQQVLARQAKVLDIRLFAKSTLAGWNKAELAALFGAAYHHLPYLGNKARFEENRDGEVDIANLDKGLAFVERELARQSVLLLCQCRRFETCHRSVVARALWARGIRTEELPDETEELPDETEELPDEDNIPADVGVTAEAALAEESLALADGDAEEDALLAEAFVPARRLPVLVTEDMIREGGRSIFNNPLALAIAEACCAVGRPAPWAAVFQGPSRTLTYEARISPDNYETNVRWNTHLGGVDIALPPRAAIFQSAWMAGPKSGPFVVARKAGVVTMRPYAEIVQPFQFELELP